MTRCALVKRRISEALDEKEPLSQDVKRHLSGCPSCKEFYAASVSLELELSSEPRCEAKPAQSGGTEKGWRLSWPKLAAIGAAAGVALAAAGYLLLSGASTPTQPREAKRFDCVEALATCLEQSPEKNVLRALWKGD